LKLEARNDLLLNICCVGENNSSFSEIVAGYMQEIIVQCMVSADENNVSLREVEAGYMQ